MRISDWSSDVCSSDLRRRSGLVDLRIVMTGALEHDRADRRARTMRAAEVGQQLEVAFAALVAEPIGRSCGMGAGQRLDDTAGADRLAAQHIRSEEHKSELQSLMRISYAVFCLKKTKKNK